MWVDLKCQSLQTRVFGFWGISLWFLVLFVVCGCCSIPTWYLGSPLPTTYAMIIVPFIWVAEITWVAVLPLADGPNGPSLSPNDTHSDAPMHSCHRSITVHLGYRSTWSTLTEKCIYIYIYGSRSKYLLRKCLGHIGLEVPPERVWI